MRYQLDRRLAFEASGTDPYFGTQARQETEGTQTRKRRIDDMIVRWVKFAGKAAQHGGLATPTFNRQERDTVTIYSEVQPIQGVLDALMVQQCRCVYGLRKRRAVQFEVVFDEAHGGPFFRAKSTCSRNALRYWDACSPWPSRPTAVLSAASAMPTSTGESRSSVSAASCCSTSPSRCPAQTASRSSNWLSVSLLETSLTVPKRMLDSCSARRRSWSRRSSSR